MREKMDREATEVYVERLKMLRRTVDLEIERAREALRILGLLEDAEARSQRRARRRSRPAPAFDGFIPSPAT